MHWKCSLVFFFLNDGFEVYMRGYQSALERHYVKKKRFITSQQKISLIFAKTPGTYDLRRSVNLRATCFRKVLVDGIVGLIQGSRKQQPCCVLELCTVNLYSANSVACKAGAKKPREGERKKSAKRKRGPSSPIPLFFLHFQCLNSLPFQRSLCRLKPKDSII